MIFKNIFVYPRYPENLQKLYDLACNLWCTWNYSAIGLFYRIDTKLFREVNHNPLMFLSSLSKQKLKDLSEDKGFLYELDNIWEKFQHYLEYDRKCADECNEICGYNKDDVIAYFSMEFGLHESIPIYAGGLGILAGDYLKGASDMDLPIVGIGLLYKYGYFTQKIDRYGHQQEVFSTFENHLIPIRELHAPDGGLAYIDVMLLDEPVKVKLWKIDVGKVELILLDTDIEENKPHLRDITNELYVGDREKRLQQELLLGIGGIKALDYLEIKTRIYHFNEGHSAFAILGRLEQLVKKDKFTLSQAIAIIRASTVFTTHTPVIAGNENFDTKLIKKYLTPKLEKIGLKFDDIAKYGFIGEDSDRFWLPAFAMNFSKYINGVSVQHAQISKHLWSGLFPQMPSVEIPIHALTNGVHNCWVSPPFTDLFTRYLGPDYIHVARREEVWKNIYNIPDEELWDEHRRNKKDLVNFIRRQFVDQMIARGFSHAKMVNVNKSLNAEFMTIVFARRFAAYKRPTLILNDKERLVRILTDTNKPVQMIFAGKAHPADDYSKNMIKEILDFAREYNVEDRVIFLENYDINIARHLFWGSDIWLNNPKPDMEASGTSGMKAAMNGVMHVSTAEGWWPEGYDGKNGWIINAGRIYSNSEQQDIADANQLYDLLEYQIIEFYYDR
ncbi:MAG: alpha-glucan family phosphorylase, partial [Phycisphaerae bacterium]|nr:alpha-glucan family phosphorylase [Phycisphaerae bacterium]